MTEDNVSCPLCGCLSGKGLENRNPIYDCPQCGRYEIMNAAEEYIFKLRHDKGEDEYNAELIRIRYELFGRNNMSENAKGNTPLIWWQYGNDGTPDSIAIRPKLTDEENSIAPFPETLEEKMNLLLLFLSNQQQKETKLNIACIARFGIKDMDEVGRVLNHSDRKGFCVYTQQGEDYTVVLTSEGQSYLDNQSTMQGNKAFVAMWFDESMTPVLDEAILPALEHCGYEPLRIDRKHFNEKICEEIYKEINNSSLVIADFTGQRSGVYFEAGFALGKGKNVIWCCRHDEIDKVHFDTRQYNHIVWETSKDLEEKLKERISATCPINNK